MSDAASIHRAATEPLVIVYRIDAADRLCHVNQAWLDFARQNDGEAVTAEKMLGRELWPCLTDETIRDLYQRMVARARQGETMHFQYRCDAPGERRVFAMRIRSAGDGAVEFRSELVRHEPRPAVPLLDCRIPRSSQLIRICSWCSRVALPDGRWVSIERAMELHPLLRSAEVPGPTHGICEECRQEMTRVIRKSRPNAEVPLNVLPE
jgi:hypothetical protein